MSGAAGLAQVLEMTLDELGLLKIARKYQVLHLWNQIVGEDISRHTRPRRLQGDTLLVATSSSVWAQELTFMKAALVEKVNQALGGRYIGDIRFSEHLWGAQRDKAGRGFQGSEALGAARLEPRKAMAKALPITCEITDPSLRRAFIRVVGAMRKREEGLLSRGYAVCRTCGAFYPLGTGACPACEHRKELAAYNRSIAILDRHPELGDEEVSRLLAGVSQAIVARARRDLDSRLSSFVQGRMPRAPRGKNRGERATLRDELGETVMKLACLRLGVSIQELTGEDVERAVGRRLANLVRKKE